MLIRYDCVPINNAHREKKKCKARNDENTFKFGIDSARKYYMTIGRQIDRMTEKRK